MWEETREVPHAPGIDIFDTVERSLQRIMSCSPAVGDTPHCGRAARSRRSLAAAASDVVQFHLNLAE